MRKVQSRPKGDPKKYKDEMWLQQKILGLLDQRGALTINEISEALEWPSDEITMYVMAMRRYGLLNEVPKGRRDKYYKYTKKGTS